MNILEYSVNGWDGTTFRATLLHQTKKKQEFQEDIYRLLRERGKDYLMKQTAFLIMLIGVNLFCRIY